ncbi:MAG: class I SAM-dependent methyltransferase [Deltaproteobacteria bacterium]|nr:class I SAM-dependent methyltransferase [Deltaproteobacteria bacterium]
MSEVIEQLPRPGSGPMFDRIAGRYDLLNRLMSLGLDRRWRRRLVEAVTRDIAPGDEILDLATGTADVAIAIAEARDDLRVIGTDPSPAMLAIGREKVSARGLSARVQLEEAAAESLPYEDGRFAAVTISFGIRNVVDRPRALREMARVTRTGGRLGILELTEPRTGLLAGPARWHLRHVVPALGAWLSRDEEYAYLVRSIAAFPAPNDFTRTIEDCGWERARASPLTFGAVHTFEAHKSP